MIPTWLFVLVCIPAAVMLGVTVGDRVTQMLDRAFPRADEGDQ